MEQAIRDRSLISLPQTAPSFDGAADGSIRRAFSPRLLSGWVIERDAPQNKIGARQLPIGWALPSPRHAEPLFVTHYFTDAAWRAEERDEVRSREAVLIHQVADQIGGARRPVRPLHFLVRGNQARACASSRATSAGSFEFHSWSTSARARNSSASLSIRTRVASITRSPHRSCRTRHRCRKIGLPRHRFAIPSPNHPDAFPRRVQCGRPSPTPVDRFAPTSR